jgi:hypothetical protein
VLCGCTGWKGELSFTLWQLLLVRKSSRYLLKETKARVTKLSAEKMNANVHYNTVTPTDESLLISYLDFHFINYVVSTAKS